MNIFLLIPEVGALSNLPLTKKFAGVFVSPNSFRKRFIFEYVHLQNLIRSNKIRHLFTFFGAGLPHAKNVRSIVTVAYPIICYPESPYWHYVAKKEQLYVQCLNILRRHRLSSASEIIVETTVMQARLARTIKFPAKQICVIPPAPSQYVEAMKLQRTLPSRRFLFISGNDSHKNLWRLPAIAQYMLKLGAREFRFLLTTSREAYLTSLRRFGIREDHIDTHFIFLGPIPPQRIMEAYRQAEVVVSLSDLESFSNNYMEAWTARLPLVVSDRDFSRNICKDSAVYVDPHRPEEVAKQFCLLAQDPDLQDMLVKVGIERLSMLPSQKERFALVIKKILDNCEILDNETVCANK